MAHTILLWNLALDIATSIPRRSALHQPRLLHDQHLPRHDHLHPFLPIQLPRTTEAIIQPAVRNSSETQHRDGQRCLQLNSVNRFQLHVPAIDPGDLPRTQQQIRSENGQNSVHGYDHGERRLHNVWCFWLRDFFEPQERGSPDGEAKHSRMLSDEHGDHQDLPSRRALYGPLRQSLLRPTRQRLLRATPDAQQRQIHLLEQHAMHFHYRAHHLRPCVCAREFGLGHDHFGRDY